MTKNIVRLVDEMNTPDAKLPQYLFTLPCEQVYFQLWLKTDLYYEAWINNFVLKYYDRVDRFYYWDRSKRRTEFVNYVYKKDLFKLKKEYEGRMIRKGYQDAATKSMGKYFDIDRAFQGYPGPLTKKLKATFTDDKH